MKIENLKGDIFGGLTAGVVALPLALAFGVQSGLGASAGLYGAMFLGLFAAILGGTATQISGPTGPMTVVSAVVISTAIAKTGSVDNALGIIIVTFLCAGLFQVLFGIIKIGKYIKYIPYPVLSGFMSGIGIIIVALQLFPLIGLTSPPKIIDVITQLPTALLQYDATSLVLGLATIAVIYVMPYLTKFVPGPLVALITLTIANVALGLETPCIGRMPMGFPKLQIAPVLAIDANFLGMILVPAITLAGLGSIDSLLTSMVADNVTKTKHNSNKELIGQGVGNMVSSIFGGIPGAGATMRTVVNVRSGGKTRLSGVIHAILLLLILLGLGTYVAYIPLSVLAGILIMVGIDIIDTKGLKSLAHIPRSDSFILLVVLALTVFVDLLQAVGIGMVIASMMFMRKASDMVESNVTFEKVKHTDHEIAWDDEARLNLAKWENVFIKHLDGPIFFGVASKILERVHDIPDDAEVVIFRMKKVPYIDQSGLYAISDLVREMQKQGIKVLFTMVQEQPMLLYKKNRFIPDILPAEHVFNTLEDCARWLKENHRPPNA